MLVFMLMVFLGFCFQVSKRFHFNLTYRAAIILLHLIALGAVFWVFLSLILKNSNSTVRGVLGWEVCSDIFIIILLRCMTFSSSYQLLHH